MEQLFLILELVGTLAFAASGAITGLKKNMDVFGVCILGLTTAAVSYTHLTLPTILLV